MKNSIRYFKQTLTNDEAFLASKGRLQTTIEILSELENQIEQLEESKLNNLIHQAGYIHCKLNSIKDIKQIKKKKEEEAAANKKKKFMESIKEVVTDKQAEQLFDVWSRYYSQKEVSNKDAV